MPFKRERGTIDAHLFQAVPHNQVKDGCDEDLERPLKRPRAAAGFVSVWISSILRCRSCQRRSTTPSAVFLQLELARECQQQEEAQGSAANAASLAKHTPSATFSPIPDAVSVEEVLPHEVPADNSCMFHAVAYLIDVTETIKSDMLRRLVAERMTDEPERWAEVAIAENRTIDAYTAWIITPSSWGGFVDLIVLSEYFQTQISVVSLDGLTWTHCPDDASLYERRIYLVYNGVHYDAVVGASCGGELRSFSPHDEATQAKVQALAAELQTAITSETLTVYEWEEADDDDAEGEIDDDAEENASESASGKACNELAKAWWLRVFQSGGSDN